MWINSWGLLLDKKIKLLKYADFLKDVVKQPIGLDLKHVTLAIQNEQKQIRVTEYINIDWLTQAEKHDVFAWLQHTLKKKEAYKYNREELILVLTYVSLKPEIHNKLEKLKKKHTI